MTPIKTSLPMKTSISLAYLLCIHILLAVVLLKSDFVFRVQNKLGIGIQQARTLELTPHYHRMLGYHKRMDGNVPDRAVIFIGDSLTQGLCVSAVAVPSVNYGIGSDTTVGVLQRLSEYRSIDRAAAVVIAIGINDLRRRSDAEILDNYETILARIPESIPVIASAVLPVDEPVRQSRGGGYPFA